MDSPKKTLLIAGIVVLVLIWAVSIALKKKQQAEMLAGENQIRLAIMQMELDGKATGDKSLGWPADVGVHSVTELKQKLVNGNYLTASQAERAFFRMQVGNVSKNDPGNTIFLRNGPVVFFKGEDGKILARDEKPGGIDPPRTPAYLAP